MEGYLAKKPGNSVGGSTTGRPIMVLFDVLGKRWMLRILWELRDERLNFRELRARCSDVSPTILNRRLKSLRELQLVDHDKRGYGLTKSGRELGRHLLKLSNWSDRWAEEVKSP